MVNDAALLEEIDAGLAEVGAVQMALVRRFNGEIQAAEGVQGLAAVAEPLDRCARSIRLTYALRVKLRKDLRAQMRDETRLAEAEAARRVRDRQDRLRNRVETLTWREADWEEDDELATEYDRILEYETLDPAFRGLPLREQAERLIARLGLKAEPYPGEDKLAQTASQPEPAIHDSA